MKKKFTMRLLAMVCVIVLCVPMMLASVSAATVGDGQEPAVFLLIFYDQQDHMVGTSAFYMEDTLGDGSTYLVAPLATKSLIDAGYACAMYGVNYSETATYITSSGSFAFFTAPGLEKMVPVQTGNQLTSTVDFVYTPLENSTISGAKAISIDISSWTSVDGGLIAQGTEIETTELLGAPVVETKNHTVVGGVTMTQNSEYAIALLEGTSFPSKAAIVLGSATTQQPAETQAPATQPQQPAATQPQQQEPQQPEGTVNANDVALVTFVVVIAAWFIIKNNKKKGKSQKTAAQADYKPVREGTIMLDPNNQKPIQPKVDVGMHSAGWQIRGLAGPLEGRVYALPKNGVLTFGRDPIQDCNVLFNSNTPGISGLHCEVMDVFGDVVLRDLQSSYGTYMGHNRVRLEPKVDYHLREGDEFMLADGGQVFRLERAGDRVQEYTPAVRSVIDGTIYRADREGRMVFGRDPRNQVTFDVNDSSVSSTHCVLYRENAALYLMDKNSTNGTYFDDNQRLRPNVPYKVKKGMSFFLTSPKYTFVITED